MNRLDDIKARAQLVAGNREGLEPTFPEIAAIIRLATFDAPPLIAAVEAVLALHVPISSDVEFCAMCGVCVPCETVEAIRAALGETDA